MPDYDYDQLFPNRFVKAGLLQGKAVTLTISEVKLEELPDEKGKNGKRLKGILSFKERDLELVLNKTNGECLKGMFGRKTGAWEGKRVTLYPKMVDAFGDEVLAIRIMGSPDIASDMRISVRVGRKTATVTMKKTATKKQAAPPPPPEPEPEADPETGEVPFDDAEEAEIRAREMEVGA